MKVITFKIYYSNLISKFFSENLKNLICELKSNEKILKYFYKTSNEYGPGVELFILVDNGIDINNLKLAIYDNINNFIRSNPSNEPIRDYRKPFKFYPNNSISNIVVLEPTNVILKQFETLNPLSDIVCDLLIEENDPLDNSLKFTYNLYKSFGVQKSQVFEMVNYLYENNLLQLNNYLLNLFEEGNKINEIINLYNEDFEERKEEYINYNNDLLANIYDSEIEFAGILSPLGRTKLNCNEQSFVNSKNVSDKAVEYINSFNNMLGIQLIDQVNIAFIMHESLKG